jgi:hypothetical protein
MKQTVLLKIIKKTYFKKLEPEANLKILKILKIIKFRIK